MNIRKCFFGYALSFNHDGVLCLTKGSTSIHTIMNKTNFIDNLQRRYDDVFFCLFHYWALKASKQCLPLVILANVRLLDLNQAFAKFANLQTLLENPNLMLINSNKKSINKLF